MNAANEPFIQLWDLSRLDQEPYYINTGSRTIKSYIEDPDFQGVSRIAVTSSKVVCALGNLIRAYSFDHLIDNNWYKQLRYFEIKLGLNKSTNR